MSKPASNTPEPSPEEIAEARLPEPVTDGQRETYEARIAELIEENERLQADLNELKKVPEITTDEPAKTNLGEWIAPIFS